MKVEKYYPLFIYLLGLGIVARYIFATDYLSGATIDNEFAIYMLYVNGAVWEPMKGLYHLQNSCLTVTLFPALLQRLVGVDPTLFYKLYHMLLLPLLPMVVYMLAKEFVRARYAVICSLFIMAQTAFLHAPSMARTNIALTMYGIVLLAIFKNDMRFRLPIGVVASVGLVLSHYTTSYLALAVIGIGFAVLFIRRVFARVKSAELIRVAVICAVIFCGVMVWHVAINKTLNRAVVYANTQVVSAVAEEIGEEMSNRVEDDGEMSSEDGEHSLSLFSLDARDKIIQVAFGRVNPDGDVNFRMNWGLWFVSWFCVGLLIFGLVLALRKKELPILYKVMAIASLLMVDAVIVIPYISRAYGIERVYYQGLVMLAPCFVIGCESIAKRLRLKPMILMLLIMLSLGVLNYVGGQILSIQG